MQMNESNSPVLGHAPKPSKTRLSPWWVLVALALGCITGAIGTVLHLNSYWTGSFGVPWGVAVALLVAGLTQWWLGIRTASMWAAGLTGIAQYITLAVLVGLNSTDHFSVPLTAETWEFVPHLVIATLLWHIGLVIVTMGVVILVNRKLRRIQHQLAIEPARLVTETGAWDNR